MFGIYPTVDKTKHGATYQDTKFYIVNVSGPAVLGLPTCRETGLISLNVDAIYAIKAFNVGATTRASA